MKWFNLGFLAVSLGVLLAPPRLLTAPPQLFQSKTHEVGIDQVSILAIEVLSDEMIMLQIRVEPAQRPKALLSTHMLRRSKRVVLGADSPSPTPPKTSDFLQNLRSADARENADSYMRRLTAN